MFINNTMDLHTHSVHSDGTLSPTELIHLAKQKNLKAISLTDHDSVNGLDECIRVGLAENIEVIPGIELSANYNDKEIHILGYYIDPSSSLLNNTLNSIIHKRNSRNNEILEKLHNMDIHITLDDLSQGCDNEVITRAHIATAMRLKGYVKENNDAFKRYIGHGCPAFVAKYSLSYTECIDLIHKCGGVAILAHPNLYSFAKDNVKPLILKLKSHGLDGVEVIYSKHSLEVISTLTSFCKANNLLITGGSDFHGANKPDINLGSGLGHTEVPYKLLSYIHSKSLLYKSIDSNFNSNK
ncbi:MAG: PHP domain-containing protein [Cellulosilyticaceae bacterium]